MGTDAVKGVATRMPLTAKWVKQLRAKWGDEFVTEQQRRAMAGERNRFYAVEAGHSFGTPFDLSERGQYLLNTPLISGASFLAVIREPDGVAHACIGSAELKAGDGAD